jgi:hypothetical protein
VTAGVQVEGVDGGEDAALFCIQSDAEILVIVAPVEVTSVRSSDARVSRITSICSLGASALGALASDPLLVVGSRRVCATTLSPTRRRQR